MFGSLRALAVGLVYDVSPNSVPATVTRSFPDDTPIVTRAIWLPPAEEDRPVGTDFQRREPRRLLTIPRSAVPTLPRGSTVLAPERPEGTAVTWRVDGLDRATDPDHWRALVVQVL